MYKINLMAAVTLTVLR